MVTTRPAPVGQRPDRHTVRPTGVERRFSPDELIVSKTDPRGIITYANDVFLRVSGYDHDDVIGQPHNLIRHPDMPRAVFALLWDTLARGEELFAYIDNLAADGANYWVLAHVTASYADDCRTVVGYHSNRRAPDPGAIAQIKPLYAQVLAEERRQPNGRAAVEAGSRLLDRLVAERASSYEELVWSVIGGGN